MLASQQYSWLKKLEFHKKWIRAGFTGKKSKSKSNVDSPVTIKNKFGNKRYMHALSVTEYVL
jgi:hypothetical protein